MAGQECRLAQRLCLPHLEWKLSPDRTRLGCVESTGSVRGAERSKIWRPGEGPCLWTGLHVADSRKRSRVAHEHGSHAETRGYTLDHVGHLRRLPADIRSIFLSQIGPRRSRGYGTRKVNAFTIFITKESPQWGLSFASELHLKTGKATQDTKIAFLYKNELQSRSHLQKSGNLLMLNE
jgi:hypothetical protein